jgi:parallel beta-helix repeat protein
MVEESGHADGLLFRYNILYDDLTTAGDEAIQIKYSDGVVMEYNYAYNIVQDAFNLSASSNGVARYNEAHDIHSENAAIYCYDATNIDLIGNLVYNVPNNDGIKLGDSGDGSTGGIVEGNEVHDAAEDGITIYASGVTVENNAIYNCDSENGALYLYGADNSTVTNNRIYNNDAIGLLIKNSSNVTVRENNIYDNDDTNDTKYIGSSGMWLTSDASTTGINNNCITGNADFGVKNEATTVVNAEHNWWGDASGPFHTTLNPSGTGDAVSDGIDFDPWLSAPIENVCPPPDDVGPITSDVVADPNPAPVGTDILLTANVDDTTTGNSNIASAEYTLYDSDGDVVSSGSMEDDFSSPTEDVNATFSVADAGVYDLCVRGTDAYDNPGPEECILLVVYDPEGGFVTGGGWIDSPEGAYVPDPSLTGKANFGFVAKYKKGAQTPEGQTEFMFKVADLNFHSDSYEWLVVAGAKAKFKGTGTINGEGEYKFMLTGIDADLNESDNFEVDRFRIKIWDEVDDTEHVVYDNGLGADDDDDNATTEIGGGSIVIHTKKK